MLHAFNATTGFELFSYIPELIFSDLWKLTDPAYTHQYFVDGSPKGWDAYIGGWKTVLVTTLGAGGKGLFALDVTNPGSSGTSDVMWEFDEENDDLDDAGVSDGVADGDLGYLIGSASVVRMADGQWAAIFGNGYDSANQHAVLFIVNIADGSLIRKIDTGVGTLNGLSTPTVVDVNGDKIADRVYAGDLLGNLWAFDISSANSDNWKVGYGTVASPAPLFTAEAYDANDTNCTTSINTQPITSQPQVGRHAQGGMMIYFGTGKYFAVGDGAVTDNNSFYAIWDNFSATDAVPIADRCDLLEQDITHELTGTFTDPDGNAITWGLRVTTGPDPDPQIDWTAHKGWFMDLESPVNGWEGERVISTPLLRENRIVFATMIPTADACSFGGDSWLMELDAESGARLDTTPFDLNGDGVFDALDYVEIDTGEVDGDNNPIIIRVPVSGKRSKAGIIKTPTVIRAGDREFKYASGSTGQFDRTTESRSVRLGRQSWRQLR